MVVVVVVGECETEENSFPSIGRDLPVLSGKEGSRTALREESALGKAEMSQFSVSGSQPYRAIRSSTCFGLADLQKMFATEMRTSLDRDIEHLYCARSTRSS